MNTTSHFSTVKVLTVTSACLRILQAHRGRQHLTGCTDDSERVNVASIQRGIGGGTLYTVTVWIIILEPSRSAQLPLFEDAVPLPLRQDGCEYICTLTIIE